MGRLRLGRPGPGGVALSAAARGEGSRSAAFAKDTRAGPVRFLLGLLRLLGRVVGGVLLGAYLLTSRVLVVVLALYLVLYFFMGSRPAKDMIQQLVSDAIPGTIGATAVQWGPLPWHVRIAEGRLIGSRGEDIIRCRGIEATIDIGKTVDDLFTYLGDETANPLRISLERVDVLEPWVRIEVHDDGWVGIERAFVAPDDDTAPAEPWDGHTFELVAEVVRVLDASGHVETPGFHLDATGLDTVSNFLLRVDHDFYMAFDVPRTDVPQVDIAFTFFDHLAEPLVVSARHVQIEDFAWRGLGFTWRHAKGVFGEDAHATFEGSGGLDAAPELVTWHGDARVVFADGAPEVPFITNGFIDGPIDVSIGGHGDIEQLQATWSIAAPELSVDGMLYGDVLANGRIEPRGTLLVPDRHALHVDGAEARLGGGRVFVDRLSYDPARDDVERDLSMAVRVEDVDVGSVLVGLFGYAIPHLPPGRWTGAATVLLHPVADVQGDTTLVQVDAAKVNWDAAPIAGLASTWTVAGRAERRTGVTGLPRGEGLGPFDKLDLRGLVVDAGPDRARLAGTIDLQGGAIDLEPYARIGELSSIARTLGFGDLAGRLVLKAARVRGTLADPQLDGVLNWTDARFGQRQLGRVKGQLGFSEGQLTLRDTTSDSEVADFSLDLGVALFEPGSWEPSKAMPFRVKTKKLQGLLVSALGPWLGPDARVSVEGGEFRGQLASPLDSLDGTGRLVVTNASIAGETGVRLVANVTATDANNKLVLDDVVVTFQSGAVWKGRLQFTGAMSDSASGAWRAGGNRSPAIEGALEIGDTSLGNLRPVAEALPDLSAILRARLTIAGTVARPVIIGTIELEDAIVGQLVLGDATLAVTTRDQVIEVSAFDDALFGGFLLDKARISLDGLSPRRIEASVRANKKRLSDLVPSFRDSAVELIGTVTAEIDIDLVGNTTSFQVTAKPQDIELSVPDRGVRWTNQTALLLVSDAGRFRMHPVTLAPAGRMDVNSPRLEACGRVDGQRLDLQLAGTVELAVVPGLTDLFSVAEGRVVIAPDALATKAIGDDTCLQNTAALLFLGGSVTAPVAVGRVTLEDMTLVPRGSGREVQLRDGATIQLRRGDRSTVQRVVLGGDGARFDGDLDDGSFSLAGEITLDALAPRSIDLDLVGADLFIQSAGEFAFTASPKARLVATNLGTPNPSMSLSGDLILSEGRFSKSFDTFARAVGGALGVKSDAYTTSLLDDLPWLGQTQLAVNVVASDFQIQTALPLARTDLPARLDLTLRGTIASPRLFRRIDLLPGGTLTYLVFERTFTVSSGAVDFDGDPERPIVDVTAATQITYLQRAQTALQEEDEKEVAVTLRMSGRVPDLKIELSSDDPTLDQADIQSLLITGKPRGDLDRAQESRVVSADLANVINTVLSAPFVRTASVGVDQKGNLEYRLGTCFAPNLCFDTTTVSDDTETTLRAKFSLSIGDDVVCEGTLKRSDTGATTAQETYEARCRYRIPLE